MKKRFLTLFLAAAMTCSLLSGCGANSGTSSSAAQSSSSSGVSDYPAKQVTIICPWGVGGGADVIARKIAQLGEKYLGQPIVVENHTGASGTIGMTDAAEAPADGYTMVVANGPLFSLTPKFIPVDYTVDDFTFLRGMRTVSLVILTNPNDSGMNTFDDVIAAGKSTKLKYATSSGPGGDQYVVASAAFKLLGIEAEAVVFDSQAEAINAVVSGQVDFGLCTPPAYYDYQKEGTAKAVATFYPEAIETEFGTVEPVKNWGVDVEFAGMDCLAIRSDVPDEIKAKLSDMLDQVYADPEFTDYMQKLGYPIWDAGTEEVTTFVNNQMTSMDTYVDLIQ